MLSNAIRNATNYANIQSFRSGSEAVDFARREKCDIAFLDIDLRDMNGLELAKSLKAINPYINIVFVTGHCEYALSAFEIYASGYILKPVSEKRIQESLNNLRYPINSPKALRVQCFGNFEVYLNGQSMSFHYHKSKELLAYLISRRGALCSNGEVIAILWEDASKGESKKEYYKKVRADLRIQFEKYGLDDILIQQRGMLGVNVEKISCDYYDWISENR